MINKKNLFCSFWIENPKNIILYLNSDFSLDKNFTKRSKRNVLSLRSISTPKNFYKNEIDSFFALKSQAKKSKKSKIYSDGRFYTGETVKGIEHGMGRLEMPNGEVYIGEFCNGLPSEVRKTPFKSGKVHKSKIKKGKAKGKEEIYVISTKDLIRV